MNEEQLKKVFNDIQIKSDMMDRVLHKSLNANVPMQGRRYLYKTAVAAISFVLFFSIIGSFSDIRRNILAPFNTNLIDMNSFESSGQINGKSNDSFLNLQINELSEELSQASNLICLLVDDYIPMTDEEFFDYYGVSLPIEEVLPSLKKQGQSSQGNNGIFKSDTRGVYFDTHAFTYANEDNTQKLIVSLTKGKESISAMNEAELKQSEINGVNMVIGHFIDSDDGMDTYYAEFTFKENGYSITGKNISKEEFIKALTAIVT